jgi:hypothetical protein
MLGKEVSLKKANFAWGFILPFANKNLTCQQNCDCVFLNQMK